MVVNVDMLGPVINMLVAYQCERCLVIPLNLGGRSRLIDLVLDNSHPFKVVANKLCESEVSK